MVGKTNRSGTGGVLTASADRYCQETEAALAEFPVDVHLERDDFYSQPDWDVFQMRYTSADGFRLFAWLSVPEGRGPFPAIIRMPDYGSVHDIVYTPLREQAVVMNPTIRGQRRSDQVFQAQFPGLLRDENAPRPRCRLPGNRPPISCRAVSARWNRLHQFPYRTGTPAARPESGHSAVRCPSERY